MDQDSAQHVGAAVAGMMGVIVVIGLVFFAFMVFLLWRIFTKAGMSGALSLLIFVPGIGGIVVLCILAFADWKVVPVASAAYAPALYPPPPPPPSFPPPTQL